jgi:hypothetical protein
MKTPEDALAAVRDARAASSARDPRRNIQRRLDDDGLGLTVEYPSPLVLAEVFALPRLRQSLDVFRSGAVILTRPVGSTEEPSPVNQLDLASDLHEALRGLPDRPDARRPYGDLQQLVRSARRGTVEEYLRATIAAFRRKDVALPVWSPPAKPLDADRGPVLTPAESKAAQRARKLDAEQRSARWWLASYVDEIAVPGNRIAPADLYSLAVEALSDFEDDGEQLDEDDDESPLLRVPGPRTFYAEATLILGARGRSHGANFYTIPEPKTQQEETPMDLDRLNTEADTLERAAASAERYYLALEALTAQRERAALGAYVSNNWDEALRLELR